MYKCFEGHKPKIKTLLHVFDHTVKPILTYGIEVWGTFDPQKLLDKGDNYFSKLCNDLKAEKAHMKFCKFSLKSSFKYFNKDRIVLYQLFLF
jgi:hypothetical protein